MTAIAIALAVFTSSRTTFSQTATSASAELALFGTTNVPPMPPGMLESMQAKATDQALGAMGIHPMDTNSGPPGPGGSGGSTNDPPPQPPPGGSTPAPYYALIDIGALPGGNYSEAYGINNKGQVVGSSGWGGSYEAGFLYSNGIIRDIGTASGWYTSDARAINYNGQIAGLVLDSYYDYHAFLDTGGSIQDLGTFGGSVSRADAINASGQVVGFAYTSNSPPGQTAFLYANGSMQILPPLANLTSEATGINASGQICGWYEGSGDVAFLYSGGVLQNLGNLGQSYAIAYGINNSGQVVGQSCNASGSYDAFIYTGGSMQDLGFIGTGNSINNNGVIVGQNGSGHAFVYANGTMTDLNSLLFNPSSGWTLTLANGINDAGQIVGMGISPSGYNHAFLLNPLPPGSIPAASTVKTNLLTYPSLPTPQKTGLVFITHGWIALGDPTLVSEAKNFVQSTSNLVTQYLADNGIENWDVEGYEWIDGASVNTPDVALQDAELTGVKIGNAILNMGSSRWTNIHFIAHSAGAGMIQKATEVIKASLGNEVTIHCTFLDAYDGAKSQMTGEYGINADWADSYFVRDLFQQKKLTGCPLPHAYNVDVTALDQNANSQVPWYLGLLSPAFQAISDHGWPPSFYSNSILGAININNFASIPFGADYNGFGFPLSEEGPAGQWTYALNNYPPGNGVSWGYVTTLGPSSEIYTTPNAIQYTGSVPTFAVASTIKSTTGTLSTSTGYASAQTGSPVWVSTVITDTNALNYVSFNAEFTSAAGADGLLTVYWDTNMIGEVDEAAVQPGLQYYVFSFPNTAPNTSHVLGFHVDPFTSVHSSLILTNIVTGSVGVVQPFSLSITTNKSDGLLVYQLTGQPGVYTVQSSADLLDWTTIAYLANTNGTINFVDQNSTNYSCQFYRATSPTVMSLSQ
jgi:probable HAF family extracellular repeat protein